MVACLRGQIVTSHLIQRLHAVCLFTDSEDIPQKIFKQMFHRWHTR